jgi:hypothetical protein
MASPWVALDSTSDRQERARKLTAARESALAGVPVPKGVVRRVISASWRRSRNAGVDADAGLAPVAVGAAEARERWESHPLASALPAARGLLMDAGSAAHQALLFCDVDGTLLWIDGEREIVHHARDVRLEPGTVWSEAAAGTNAMGTALATGHPVQVFSAEHYARPVHDWTCSAAPIRDAETGMTIGVLDLSGKLETAHPHSLAVVTAAARIVEQELARAADESAARLVRAYGDRVGRGARHPDALATVNGRVLVTAHAGLAGRRLALPLQGGTVGIPGGGSVVAEPVRDREGFLLWVARDVDSPEPDHVRLEVLGREGALLTVGGSTCTLSPRHSELLTLLALRPRGWSAEQLADELLGEFGKAVSIRAELSRLRRILGPLLASHPYRLDAPIATDFAEVEASLERADIDGALRRFAAGELLPASGAPTVAEARFRLTTTVREAVIASAEPDLLGAWLRLPAGDDDVQACRALIRLRPPSDPLHSLAAGRLRRLSAHA